jgi:hypothetical protein
MEFSWKYSLTEECKTILVAEEALKFEYTAQGLKELKEHALEISLLTEQDQIG